MSMASRTSPGLPSLPSSVRDAPPESQTDSDLRGGPDADHTNRPQNPQKELEQAAILAALRRDLALSAAEAGEPIASRSHTTLDHTTADRDAVTSGENYGEDLGETEPVPPPHPSDFAPLYTVITDPSTDNHTHPTVHYIFADDDPELFTDALLASARVSAMKEQADRGGPGNNRMEPSEDEQMAQRQQEERVIIVDMSADGKQVASAVSLSPNWQAVKTNIVPAPSWRGGDSQDGTQKGLMLRISGQEGGDRVQTHASFNRDVRSAAPTNDLDALIQAFDERLTALDGVLGAEIETIQEEGST